MESTMGPGAHGEHVRDVQARLAVLGYPVDSDEPAIYGAGTEAAVQRFQQRRNLLVDGLVGPDTWQEIVEAGYSLGDRVLYLRYPLMRGDDVRALQTALNQLGFDAGKEDGILGERTERAARDFQRNAGLTVDGIAGPTSVQALARLRSGAGGGGPGFATVREGLVLHGTRRPSVEGARVAIDPAHGPGEPGAFGIGGLSEAAAAFALAERLAAELRARGAEVMVLRGADEDPSSSERARRANDAQAEAFVSLHLEAHAGSGSEGATVFYCGREDWFSRAGQHLAGSVRERLTELGLPEGGILPMWLPILRETRMPAVHVTPCRVGDAESERRLREPAFVAALAEALATGVERFFTTSPHAEAPVG